MKLMPHYKFHRRPSTVKQYLTGERFTSSINYCTSCRTCRPMRPTNHTLSTTYPLQNHQENSIGTNTSSWAFQGTRCDTSTGHQTRTTEAQFCHIGPSTTCWRVLCAPQSIVFVICYKMNEKEEDPTNTREKPIETDKRRTSKITHE